MIWQPTQGTVEERMEAVQARKQRMISGALTDQEVRTARIEELKMLFSWDGKRAGMVGNASMGKVGILFPLRTEKEGQKRG